MKYCSSTASAQTPKPVSLKLTKTDLKTTGIAPVGLVFQHK